MIDRTYEAGFSQQALTERMEGLTEMERQVLMQEMQAEAQLITGRQFSEELVQFRRVEFGLKPSGVAQATIRCNTVSQPLFHKNFDLLVQTLADYQRKGYHLYILADSQKQQERLREIFSSMEQEGKTDVALAFQPIDKTLHEGFIDDKLKLCLFTDHQIFDRFHKYNLRSDAALGRWPSR